jgi:hypothetical protein
MRLPFPDFGSHSSGAIAPDEILDLLEAAEELGGQLDAEPVEIVRQLTALLRKRSAFNRMRVRFGVSLEV